MKCVVSEDLQFGDHGSISSSRNQVTTKFRERFPPRYEAKVDTKGTLQLSS